MNELQLVVEVPLSRTSRIQLEFDFRARCPRVREQFFCTLHTCSRSAVARIHINTGVHSNRSTFFKKKNKNQMDFSYGTPVLAVGLLLHSGLLDPC